MPAWGDSTIVSSGAAQLVNLWSVRSSGVLPCTSTKSHREELGGLVGLLGELQSFLDFSSQVVEVTPSVRVPAASLTALASSSSTTTQCQTWGGGTPAHHLQVLQQLGGAPAHRHLGATEHAGQHIHTLTSYSETGTNCLKYILACIVNTPKLDINLKTCFLFLQSLDHTFQMKYKLKHMAC